MFSGMNAQTQYLGFKGKGDASRLDNGKHSTPTITHKDTPTLNRAFTLSPELSQALYVYAPVILSTAANRYYIITYKCRN